ncbi:MAG: RNase adapter RapZ [Candidatus Eisenbacteria bacterium]
MNQDLTVHIYSFSYLRGGIPEDPTGHGGGFVFDCRVLPNPGREERFKDLTGRDPGVVRYLDEREEARVFWDRVIALVLDGAQTYRARGFDHLTVAFGCTGGQHRSVYFAEKLRRALEEHGVACTLVHRDLSEASS